MHQSDLVPDIVLTGVEMVLKMLYDGVIAHDSQQVLTMTLVKALRPKKDLYSYDTMDDRGGRPIMVASVISNNVMLDLLGDILNLHRVQWMVCTECDDQGYVKPGSSLIEMLAAMRPTPNISTSSHSHDLKDFNIYKNRGGNLKFFNLP